MTGAEASLGCRGLCRSSMMDTTEFALWQGSRYARDICLVTEINTLLLFSEDASMRSSNLHRFCLKSNIHVEKPVVFFIEDMKELLLKLTCLPHLRGHKPQKVQAGESKWRLDACLQSLDLHQSDPPAAILRCQKTW